MESIVLGGGCFWCIEAIYRRVKGVESAVSGYAGGTSHEPDYQHIADHAEVVKVDFKPEDISLDKILEIFWSVHDPTTLNRQGNDVGTQYRSIILYSNAGQKTAIENSIESVAKKLWDKPLATEVDQLDEFFEAEEYHQDYFSKNPEAGYCQLIINPKIKKFEEHFKDILKPL